MNRKPCKGGFTLLEILVAMAIIVTIVSMVYGSYFATSKSTQVYDAKITESQQARRMLQQVARQIRCSYVYNAAELQDQDKLFTEREKSLFEKTTNFFYSDPDAPSREILHLVTTNGIFRRQDTADGLFDVTYKFDKNSATLFLNQKRFVETSKHVNERKKWQPLLTNVCSLELEFYDGQKWKEKWNFEQERGLPRAVKISVTLEDENRRQYQYGTVVCVYCWKSQSNKVTSERTVSVNRQ